MKSIRLGLGLVWVALAGLGVLPAEEIAASGGDHSAAPAGFRSYGDFRAVNVEEELAALRDGNEGLVGSVALQPVTLAEALAKARALANAAVAPTGLGPVLRALLDNEPVTLRLLAAAQLADGNPSAAFALLVAALDRDPRSVETLSDLAGMLAGFGYANEAIAILDELAARNALPSPPMGISGRDAVAYIRGYALARLGQTEAARSLLVGVSDREPQLAEASRLLVLLSEDPAEQRKYLLRGTWRHRSPLMVADGVSRDGPEPMAEATGTQVAIDLRSLINPGKGLRGRQPSMHYAKDVRQANDLVGKMAAAKQAAAAADRALGERRVLPTRYVHTDTDVQETWGYRISELIATLQPRDARLRELDQRRRVLWREREAARSKIIEERNAEAGAAMTRYLEECIARRVDPIQAQIGERMRPAHEAALARIMPYLNREELAERAWFAEWHYLATALAAQVGDSAWHEYIQLSIEAKRWRSYGQLLHLVQMHASVGENTLVTAEPGQVPENPEGQNAEKCDSSQSVSFGTSHLPGGKALPFEFGVEMTCEGMSLEAAIDTRIPGVSISAEIGGDNQGSFSAFIGPKAEAIIGDKEIAAFTGSAKAGAYVTGNRHGVTDAGVKYEVKAGAKLGSYSAAQKVAEGNVSFFPAPQPSVDFGPLAR